MVVKFVTIVYIFSRKSSRYMIFIPKKIYLTEQNFDDKISISYDSIEVSHIGDIRKAIISLSLLPFMSERFMDKKSLCVLVGIEKYIIKQNLKF